ncbi:hypothetical protein [Streptomyces halstedii]|uniref:hypothetical protein n=1 Tax=Streptomyces halstedii TaxID=1944 RepID=UPI003359D6CE
MVRLLGPWFEAPPDSDDAQRAATEAAAKAQTRTAEHLLSVRLEQLHARAAPSRSGPRRGRGVCPSLPPARWTARPWR